MSVLDRDVSRVDVEDIANKMISPETNEVLNILPDIPSTLMNEDVSWDDNDEVDHRESVVSDISNNEIPIGLLSIHDTLKMFIEWDLLKSCSVYDPPIIDSTLKFLETEKAMHLFEGLFWMVHVLKFHPENSKLLKKLRRKISYSYTTTLSLCPNPKQDILGLLHFVYGYMIHMMHCKLFIKHKDIFNIRFVLDCYHIVVYELTGLLVSDVYVYNQIDRIYGDKFFMYKQDGILDLTNIDMYEGSVFMQKTKVDKKDIEKLRMGDDYSDATRRELAEFGAQLTDRFTEASKMLHASNKTNLLLAKYEGELAKKIDDLSNKQNFQELLVNRARKINESQIRSEDGHYDSSFIREGSVDNIVERLDESKQLIKKKSNQSSLPLLKIKQKFDCGQVSPPLQMAAKNINATTKKKTIGFTSFNIPEFSIDKLSELFEKQMKKTKEKPVVYKTKDKKSNIPAGPFDERNTQKYGQGSESLLKDGVPSHLRKKFTEFYIIKNVALYNKVYRGQIIRD